ncbi:MAG: rod shape-determining protein MreD [Gemmatimonadales bacterium]
MTLRRGSGRLVLGFGLLLALHFYVRPRLWDNRAAPDFLLLALMLFAIRARPGTAAVAGFLVGLVNDVLTPAHFGAGALAHTIVGYLAAWGRAVFFPHNLMVNAGFFAGAVLVRNLIVFVASGSATAIVGRAFLVWTPLQALTTAITGTIILLVLRDWFAIRIAA